MRKLSAGVIGALSLAGVHVSWYHFHSDTYPYTVTAPSSYRHVLIQDSANHKIDYFFPALGSFTTNANIWAEPGPMTEDGVHAIESIGGRHVRQIGWLTILGHRVPLDCGDFRGLAGRWTIEQVDFRQGGLTWHLTASFDPRYRRVLPTLLRILRTFHTAG